MAIHKRFIHFKEFKDFNSKKLSANETNTQYTLGVSGEIQEGDPDVLYQSYVWIKDTQQQWTHGQLYNGRHFVVDEILSDDSINPVANKAIKEYVDLHSQYEPVDEINVPVLELPMVKTDDALSATSIYPVQNRVVTHALNSKVDKVSGKQLSTEDFTTILKNKLLGLTNYDDTAINNAVKSLETKLNTLVNGDVTTAIDSYNDIIAFLENISDYETLDGIIAGIERQIAAIQQSIPDTSNLATKAELNSKQNVLVSGTNIKTINGENILGSGNVEINTKITVDDYVSDTSTNPIQNKVIKKYIDNKVINIDTSNLATKAELNAKQDKISDLNVIRQGAMLGGTALQSVPDEYITENDLSSKGYITQSQLVNKQDTIDDLEAIRRGAFLGATALQEDQFKGTVTSIVMNEEVQPQNDAGIVNLGGIATKEELNHLSNEIVISEEIHAEALIDLNNKKVSSDSFEKSKVDINKQITDVSDHVNLLESDLAYMEEMQSEAINDLNSKKASVAYVNDSLANTDGKIQDVIQDAIDGEEIHAAAFNDINTRKTDKTYVDNSISTINNYVDNISSDLTNLSNEVIIDEEVYAATFNDINTRKSDKTYVDDSINDVNEQISNVIEDIINSELTYASSCVDIENKKADKTYVDSYASTTNTIVEGISQEFSTLKNEIIESEDVYAALAIDLDNRKAEKTYVDNSLATFLSEFVRFKNEGVPVVDVVDNVICIEPNKYYKWTNAMSSITITLFTPPTTGTLNNYMFEFKVGSSGCMLTLPDTIKWANGEPPELKSNRTYQVSIINNLAVTSMFG